MFRVILSSPYFKFTIEDQGKVWGQKFFVSSSVLLVIHLFVSSAVVPTATSSSSAGKPFEPETEVSITDSM